MTQTHRHIDRQNDIQTGTHTDRQPYRIAGRKTVRQNAPCCNVPADLMDHLRPV